MGWISMTLIISIIGQLFVLLVRSDQLTPAFLRGVLPRPGERAGQIVILLLSIVPLAISIYHDVSTNRKKQALEKLKLIPPIVNAWLEIEYGPFFTVAIKCGNSVPINLKWSIGTMAKEYQEGSFRSQVSSGNEFEPFYPSNANKCMYIDSRTSRFPVSYAASIAETYNVVMVVRYKSIYFEEMQYKSELEGEIIRKYELVDYSLKDIPWNEPQ